ncbi:MAG: alpha/beta fold hydrolase [Planctomycetota bacterium]|nr:alpha/beta fold hydrolase [Planctomycetota bacterium]MEE3365127.1 alpha/beta fold hydrolase [Planctomycetota bacterium]
MVPELLCDGPSDAERTIVLAHGAGRGWDSPSLVAIAEGLARAGHRVVRFEFPYMVRRREDGTRRPPDRQPVLLETWRAVIEALGPDRLVIGGKSMGGRMASLVADECGVAGLVCLGYPFHPPAKPEKLRTEHLAGLSTPTLIVQGDRDRFGTPGEVAGYLLSEEIRVHWMPDGDHDLVPRKKSGRTAEENWAEAVDVILGFIDRQR